MAVRNSFERFVPSAVAVFGLVTGGNPPTISNQSGDLIADQQNVSISRTGAGVYVISITNFRGQHSSGNQRVNVNLTPAQPGDSAAAGIVAYAPNTDTLQVTTYVLNQAGSLVDDSYYFGIYAF